MQTEELRALLARVEACPSDGDRALDASIADNIGEESDHPGSHLGYPHGRAAYLRIASPSYTASIDASAALVERCLPDGSWTAARAFFCPEAEGRPFFGDAASRSYIEDTDGNGDGAFGQAGGYTPALALVTALLRALLARADSSNP